MRKKHRGKQIDFFFLFPGRPNYRAGINKYCRGDRHASVMHCNGPRGINVSFFCLTCCCGMLSSQWGCGYRANIQLLLFVHVVSLLSDTELLFFPRRNFDNFHFHPENISSNSLWIYRKGQLTNYYLTSKKREELSGSFPVLWLAWILIDAKDHQKLKEDASLDTYDGDHAEASHYMHPLQKCMGRQFWAKWPCDPVAVWPKCDTHGHHNCWK